jgi:hypothetical protein
MNRKILQKKTVLRRDGEEASTNKRDGRSEGITLEASKGENN